MKLARVSRPGKVARGTSVVVLRTCGAGKKVSSHGLADLARLQEARAKWLGELAVQEMKLAQISRPGKVSRGTSVVALRTCGAGKKVSSHGLADLARLQEARAKWLGELAVQEMKLAQISRPGKVSKLARVSGPARFQETRARWLDELAMQESKLERFIRPRKVQEARARWLGELAVQEMKLARVSRPGKVARGTSKVARRTCEARKHERGGTANLRFRKVSSHGLADPARLHEARRRWLDELAMQESCKRHERGGSANLRCKKVNSNGLADPARLQEARAKWLGELAVQEMELVRVSRPGKVARGTSKAARRTCGARKKVSSYGLVDPAREEEARARWLGELAVQESRLTRVSKPGIDAKGISVVAQRTCGVGK
ncbi:hypothetical protein CRG98_044507 [Punica granatum]|uniref:Uncharacterized protein n=1 Tax=Punica granatum TaxID=22663 RepID=A0A2I0HTR1_PUNGR|nr:hypothetical protein CRG98_044507 [Punica granatum]